LRHNMTKALDIYFSQVFDIEPSVLDAYGAFDVSLINDLPLFVDPFLLFNSKDPQIRGLHEEIIRYLRFLRDKAAAAEIDDGLLEAWFTFREVKQNWLGFSLEGNEGSGLGMDFARALHRNLNTVFKSFGNETITRGSHLEKLCLIRDGVGRDNISDFTTTLIKEYLLRFTQAFALEYVKPEQRKLFAVKKVRFNYETESWEQDQFDLPALDKDYVLLTPKTILTKSEIWINRPELLQRMTDIADAQPNVVLRAQINNYFARQLSKKPTEREIQAARIRTLEEFPELIEYYIRSKEDDGAQAESVSKQRVREAEVVYRQEVQALRDQLARVTAFYETGASTYDEAKARVLFLKDVIENKDGYRIFYRKGEALTREEDLQLLYRLVWFGSVSDVNREVNNGRGPVDFAVSRGALDKTLVEFKLGSNSHLKRNLEKQVAIYQKAADAPRALKVITNFSAGDEGRVSKILAELKLTENPDVIVIDARRDNKPSASTA
jgi:hypothetical protein